MLATGECKPPSAVLGSINSGYNITREAFALRDDGISYVHLLHPHSTNPASLSSFGVFHFDRLVVFANLAHNHSHSIKDMDRFAFWRVSPLFHGVTRRCNEAQLVAPYFKGEILFLPQHRSRNPPAAFIARLWEFFNVGDGVNITQRVRGGQTFGLSSIQSLSSWTDG